MVETRNILPPEDGLRSDPLLFGVAEALALLFPVDERHFSHRPPERPGSDAREAACAGIVPAEHGVVTAE